MPLRKPFFFENCRLHTPGLVPRLLLSQTWRTLSMYRSQSLDRVRADLDLPTLEPLLKVGRTCMPPVKKRSKENVPVRWDSQLEDGIFCFKLRFKRLQVPWYKSHVCAEVWVVSNSQASRSFLWVSIILSQTLHHTAFSMTLKSHKKSRHLEFSF